MVSFSFRWFPMWWFDPGIRPCSLSRLLSRTPVGFFLSKQLVLSFLLWKKGRPVRGNILCPLPHRQYVFSIPIILHKLFLYNRKLLSTLCKAASDSLQIFFRTVTGLKDGIVRTVMIIQTVGDYAKWYPSYPRHRSPRHRSQGSLLLPRLPRCALSRRRLNYCKRLKQPPFKRIAFYWQVAYTSW